MNLLAVIFGGLSTASGIWGLVVGKGQSVTTISTVLAYGSLVGSVMILAGGLFYPTLVAYGLILWGLLDIVTGITDFVSPATLVGKQGSGLAKLLGGAGGVVSLIFGVVFLYFGYTMLPSSVPSMGGRRR